MSEPRKNVEVRCAKCPFNNLPDLCLVWGVDSCPSEDSAKRLEDLVGLEALAALQDIMADDELLE